MPDTEKVIKGLEECAGNGKCTKCQYGKEKQALSCKKLLADALELLKEQEAAEPISFMDGIVERFACKKCGKHLLMASWGRDNYCSKCGQKVKWER